MTAANKRNVLIRASHTSSTPARQCSQEQQCGISGGMQYASLTREEDLSAFDGFAGPGARALHQRPLLRQQQVVFGLVHQVPAALVRLDEQVRAHGAHQELWVQQRHTDMLQDLKSAGTDMSDRYAECRTTRE